MSGYQDLQPLIDRLDGGYSLSAEESSTAFEIMMSGVANDDSIADLLTRLASRAPTTEELLGGARVMRRHADLVPTTRDPDSILDTCGTGGAPKTFNVSTVAAIIAAAGGATVAKHGNRSRTGRGSAEVLQGLGVNVDADRDVQAACLDSFGLCFCFAIHHHPAVRHVMPVRRKLGFPTIFNLLGPLTNPAGARRQLLGVWNVDFMRPVAEVLARLETACAVVLHAEDGLDEASIATPTRMIVVRDGMIQETSITPEDAGLQRASLEAVTVEDLDESARLARGILNGAERGPSRDMAMLNAGIALLAAGIVKDVREGVHVSAEAIDDGRAASKLDQLVTKTSIGS